MNFPSQFKDKIFKADNDNFPDLALELFRYQAQSIPVYGEYLSYIGCLPNKIKCLTEIRFLPISFFKTHKITIHSEAGHYFQSSGTTASERSKHYVDDLDFYTFNARRIFESTYGSLKDYLILALLPSYQENTSSSLLFMVDDFMKYSKNNNASYFKTADYRILEQKIIAASLAHKKVLLIGVTFALLDMAALVQWYFPDVIVMETGGMKGRREELTRAEVHLILKAKLGVASIHSEYGMTELRSQAYATAEGNFCPPPWMRIMIRQINDPYSWAAHGTSGGINIIDLGNIESCAFIETQDLGRANDDGTFEVLGRIDHSESRGCNLLVRV